MFIRSLKRLLKNELTNMLFLIPALVLLLYMVVLPFLQGILYSFTNWNGITEKYNFVGLKNFIILASDRDSLGPIKNTLYFVLVTVIPVNLLSLFLAYLVSQKFRGVGLCKTIFFMPLCLSLIMTAFIWTYINQLVFYPLLGKNLLANVSTVIPGIAIMAVWRGAGLLMVIYLAALLSVPKELMEASRIDGASRLQQMWHVELPLMMQAFTVNVTLLIGGSLKVFEYPMAATAGGPIRASESIAMHIYKYTFTYNRVGYGQAVALLMTASIFLIVFLVSSALRKREVEL